MIGQRSYGIYLSHFLVISLLEILLGNGSLGYLPFATVFILTLFASYAIAAKVEDIVNRATAPIRRMLVDDRHAVGRAKPVPGEAFAAAESDPRDGAGLLSPWRASGTGPSAPRRT